MQPILKQMFAYTSAKSIPAQAQIFQVLTLDEAAAAKIE
jgi:hypothetical protein